MAIEILLRSGNVFRAKRHGNYLQRRLLTIRSLVNQSLVHRRGPTDSTLVGTLNICPKQMKSMQHYITTRLLTAASIVILQVGLATQQTVAGTDRDDVSDSAYLTFAAQPALASVGKITIGSSTYSGVLIDSQWMLTTAHITSAGNPGIVVNLGGLNYGAAEWIPHPQWDGMTGLNGNDIALIRLSAPVTGITPAALYTGTSELGSAATIAGFGQTGTGLTGPSLSGGTLRAGQNVLDVPGSVIGRSNNYLVADFDNPSSTAASSFGAATPLPLEYMPAAGDDGGGAFITDGGTLKLAGLFAFGLKGPVSNPGTTSLGHYGDLMAFTRVSAFDDWIAEQTSAHYWKGASGGAFDAASNWEEGAAPGADDLAVFNTAGGYVVTFTGDVANQAIRVRTGDVTLNLAGHSYTLSTTALEGSMIVGQRSGDNAKLNLVGGTSSAMDVSIGELAGSTGQLNVSGPGTVLNLSGSLGIGGSPSAAGGTGTLVVDNAGAIQVAGKLSIWGTNIATFNGGPSTVGSFALSGGTITGIGNLTVTSGGSTWTGGTISGTGTATIANGATLTISDIAAKSLSARNLVNAGTINWTGTGSINGSLNAVINNQSGAVFDAQSDSSISGLTINNAGLFKKSAGTGTTTVSATFNNTGAVQVQNGTLNLGGGGTESGTFDVAPGASINFAGGTYNFNSGIALTGTGASVLGGATLVIAGDNTFDNWSWTAGTLSGMGTTSVSKGNALNLSTSSLKTLTSRTLSNFGAINWAGIGSISGSNALINNQLGSVFDTQDNGSLIGAGNVFNNFGLFKKSGGTTTTSIGWTFNNSGMVQVQTGTLNLAGGGTQTGNFDIASGATLNLSSALTLNGATFPGPGTVTLSGFLTATGDNAFNNLNWTSGSLSGAGVTTIPSTGVLSFSGTGSRTLSGRTLANQGAIVWTGTGSINGSTNNAVINNQAGGIFDAQDNASLTGGTGNVFNNFGLFKKSAGTGTTTIGWTFNNSGTVQVQSGTLSLSAGGTHTGTFDVAAGATLSLTGGTHNLPSVTGAGNFALNGATLVITGDNSFNNNFSWLSGSLTGTGTTTVAAGTVQNLSGNGARTLNGRTLANQGTIIWTGGSINGSNNAVLVNQSGSAFDSHGDGSIQGGAGNVFNNVGLFTKSAGTGTTSLDWTFNNSGTVQVQTGKLSLASGGTHTGTFDIAAGATLSLTGGTDNLPTVTGAGTFELNGATLVITGDNNFDSKFSWLAGTLAGAGTTTVPSGAVRTLAQSGNITLSGRALANQGTLNVTSASLISGTNNAVINNQLGGVFDLQANASFSGGATNVFNNDGLLKKSAGTGTSTIDWKFNNNGTVQVQTGTLSLSESGTHTGIFDIAAGAKLSFSGGTHTLPTVTGAGVLELAGATFAITGDNSFNGLSWTAGGLSGAGVTTIPTNATLALSGSGTKTLDGRTFTNAGTISWAGTGSITGGHNAVITNQVGGVFDAQGDAGFDFNSANIFNNAGLFKKSAGTGTTSVGWTFNNSGDVQVQTGTLNLAGGGTQSGTFEVSAGATLQFTGAEFFRSGSAADWGRRPDFQQYDDQWHVRQYHRSGDIQWLGEFDGQHFYGSCYAQWLVVCHG